MGLPLQIALCVCERVCTRTDTFTRVHMQVHMLGYVHVWGGYGPASGISPQDSIHLVLESQFFLPGNSQIQRGWLGHEPQGSTNLHLPLLWVQVSATSPIFFVRMLGMRLRFSCLHSKALHQLICLPRTLLTLFTTCTEFRTV